MSEVNLMFAVQHHSKICHKSIMKNYMYPKEEKENPKKAKVKVKAKNQKMMKLLLMKMKKLL